MNLKEGKLLKVVKPLYGIPEPDLHWYLTYFEHHLAKLNMLRSRADPCLLYNHDGKQLNGRVVILQADDSLVVRRPQFTSNEERSLHVSQLRRGTSIKKHPPRLTA